MNSDLITISIVIAVVFIAIKIVEGQIYSNVDDKPSKPMKSVVFNACIVFLSSYIGIFTYNQLSNVKITTSNTEIFTNDVPF